MMMFKTISWKSFSRALSSSVSSQQQQRKVNWKTTQNNKRFIPYPKPRNRPKNGQVVLKKKPSKECAAPPYKRVLINGICKILKYSPSWECAEKELSRMPHLRWDSYTITQVLKAHPPLERAFQFFNWTATLPKFKHDQFTYTTMMDLLGEAGRIHQMKELFKQMGGPGLRIDCVTYTTVMHRLAEAGDIDGAIQAWESLKQTDWQPTVISYTEIIRIFLTNNRPEQAATIYKEMLGSGIQPNCHTYTVLIEYLAEQGKFEEAFGILNEMKNTRTEPSKATFNILVQKCAKAKRIDLINDLLMLMRSFGHVLRLPVFLKALKAFHKAKETDDLLRAVHPHFSEISVSSNKRDSANSIDNDNNNIVAGTKLIQYLLHCKNFAATEVMLEQMTSEGIILNSAVMTTIIQDCSAKGKLKTVLKAYSYCKMMKILVDKNAYTSLLGLLMRNGSIENLVEIVNEMIQDGVNPGCYLLSVLIRKFGHYGLVDVAQRLFDALPSEQNVLTYTGLIDACLNSGAVNKAIGQYQRMKRNCVNPARGTYTVLQLGLEKVCRYQEAKDFRNKRLKLRTMAKSKNLGMEEEYLQLLCNLIFDSDFHIYEMDTHSGIGNQEA